MICTFCGGEGIRTPGTVTRTPVFETGSFNHSDTPPFMGANFATLSRTSKTFDIFLPRFDAHRFYSYFYIRMILNRQQPMTVGTMHRSGVFCIFCLLYVIIASGGLTAYEAAASPHALAAGAPPVPDELPLPSVPSVLRTPADRAAYIIDHFWDAMDFGDTLRSRDKDFMELNFVNFISLYPIVRKSPEILAAASKKLVMASEIDGKAFGLLAETAEKYLYEPNSPMHDEDFYIYFLDAFMDSPHADAVSRGRFSHQRSIALKNRPGTVAADFSYVTADGHASTLHGTPVEGEYLLLMFYDPACGHCKETLSIMRDDPAFADGGIKVLAVVEGDGASRGSAADGFPRSWTVAYDAGDIGAGGLYVFRAMPSLYLLDRDKKVILKDVPLQRLYRFLAG